MDRITQRQAQEVLADLANSGGGTYQAGTLLPFRPDSGFAVGIGGLRLPEQHVGIEAVVWALKAVTTEYECSYGGTWLDDGVVYFDAVQYFAADRREAAVQAGIDAGQKAIFDFSTKEAVNL